MATFTVLYCTPTDQDIFLSLLEKKKNTFAIVVWSAVSDSTVYSLLKSALSMIHFWKSIHSGFRLINFQICYWKKPNYFKNLKKWEIWIFQICWTSNLWRQRTLYRTHLLVWKYKSKAIIMWKEIGQNLLLCTAFTSHFVLLFQHAVTILLLWIFHAMLSLCVCNCFYCNSISTIWNYVVNSIKL